MKKLTVILSLIVLAAFATGALAAKSTDDKIKDLEKQVRELQTWNAKSKIKWGGDLRVETHNITGEVDPYFDGMQLQYLMTGSMFAQWHVMNPDFGDSKGIIADPMDPASYMDPATIERYIGAYYGDYQMWSGNLSFADLAAAVGSMPPAQMAQFMGALMPATLQDGYKTDNSVLYTTRLRLKMQADVSRNVDFTGRLSMYKPWGASTQTGVFNGQANTLNTDANWPGTPGDATLKLDRAYFTWKKMFGQPMYLSLGRRPSTDGPPLHYRHDEVRAGTPMGTIIDMQFDGATFGYNISDKTTVRACYGLGYESQYGNGVMDKDQALKDAHFFGFNIDAWTTPEMQIQTTVARAFDITDGFNGQIIMPNNPVTGAAMPGPIVTRFSPSVNLGDFDIASVLVARRDGPFDWFVTGSWSKSHPEEGVYGPFGGLFSDPFQNPESQSGSMYYLGARYNFDNDKTKVGLEWNKGSQYWFNFAPSQDDLIAPKTSTRGTVWEGYLTHRITRKFVMKLAYISYDFDFTGTGWHVGAPKELDGTPVVQGFPTYKKAGKLSLGFSARF
ncbi:MAG: DUF3373 domain-containing protein [bacterium]|nr:DUF3373 domain-containing protein [bacterium]